MLTERMNDTHVTAEGHRGHDLPVGAGASIVIAVATSLVLAMTLLFASLAPAHAAVMPPVETAADAGNSGSLSIIVVTAVLAVWLAVSADLWRALFNRVKSWDRSRS